MRLEYLWIVAKPDASDLTSIISNNLSIPVYFLQLGFFSNFSIKEYLKERVINDSDLFEKVENNFLLLEILHRPLYLRIFCDLWEKFNEYDRNKLLKVKHAAELFDKFVEQASKENIIAQEKLPSYEWNIEKLSRKTLELYQSGQELIDIEEVEKFLDPTKSSADEVSSFSKESEAKLRYIHKCPFLQRVSEKK